jgi:ATP/ADP translocase
MLVIIGRMVEVLHHKLVFYASVAPLVAFYGFFAAVLYPASAALHPHGFYAAAAPLVPIGLRGLLKVNSRFPCHELMRCEQACWRRVCCRTGSSLPWH